MSQNVTHSCYIQIGAIVLAVHTHIEGMSKIQAYMHTATEFHACNNLLFFNRYTQPITCNRTYVIVNTYN